MSQRSRVPLQDGELHEDDFGRALGEVLRQSECEEDGEGPSEDDDTDDGESRIVAQPLKRKPDGHC
jgi:hypothetical protein